jgi:acylpyruvate hydrolase
MKIICIGRNYINHAKELGNAVPKEPVFFLKPDTALLLKKQPFFIPDFSNEIHYETELVVKIDRLGKNIQQKFASKYYSEIGLGLDFTARDIQQECKSAGLPWEKAKAFDGSALMSQKLMPVSELNFEDGINFNLLINGEQKQIGNSKEMLFSIDAIIAYVSKYFTLKIGDLIFTGTPEGVGKINPGDELVGFIEQEEMFKVKIK